MLVILFCYLVSVSATHDKSEDVRPKTDVDKRLAYLNEHIPKSFYCCKNGELDTSKWADEKYYHSNTSCIDKNGVRSNYSLDCERVFDFDAGLEDYPDIEFNFEDDILSILDDTAYINIVKKPNMFCFGNTITNNESRLRILSCLDTDDEEGTGADARTTVKLALVSIPFAVLTVIIYAMISELRDLQGLSILCMCSAYTVSLIMIINGTMNISYVLNSSMCHAGGLILYYSIIASFLWMQVISMQLFVSIRFPKLPFSWRKQFQWYSIYAWGVAGFFLLLVMIAEITPGQHLLPGIGMNNSCWFNGKAAKWAYFLGPMTVVLISNTLLYLASIVLIFRQKNSSDYRKLRYKYFLSLRLFIVIGITWLAEPLQLAHGENHIIWVMADCWNMLQGVFIFIVLVLFRKRAVLALISRGYWFCLTPYLQTLSNKLSSDEEETAIVENDIKTYPGSTNDENADEEIII